MRTRARSGLKMSRFEIEERAPAKDRMHLSHSAPYVSYVYALDRGWITKAEYDEAQGAYGRLWAYCGD